MDKDMERQKAQLALGGCVSLLAAVTGQPEKQLTPWLDLYYEVRHRYEIAAGRWEVSRMNRRKAKKAKDLGFHPAIWGW